MQSYHRASLSPHDKLKSAGFFYSLFDPVPTTSVMYAQVPLHYEQLAARLINKGLIVEDSSVLISKLQSVSYSRLREYWYPLISDGKFVSGTTFEDIWLRYEFDRQLRLLLMDWIERVEVAILRTRFVHWFVHKYGPLSHWNSYCFESAEPIQYKFAKLSQDMAKKCSRLDEEFLHSYEDSDRHNNLPFWIVAEVLDVGDYLSFFRCLSLPDQKEFARTLKLPAPVVDSWINVIQMTRNICAHHGRLWNRELGVKPKFPYAHLSIDWYEPVLVPNNRIFGVLTIFKYLLDRIIPQNCWRGQIVTLLASYPTVPQEYMGIPANWQECPIWS